MKKEKINSYSAGKLWIIRIFNNEYYMPVKAIYNNPDFIEILHSLGYKKGRKQWTEKHLSKFLNSLQQSGVTSFQLPPCLRENLEKLGKVLSLNETEKILLAFLVICRGNSFLQKTCRVSQNILDFQEFISFLAFVLDKKEKEIQQSISKSSSLVSSGILTIDFPAMGFERFNIPRTFKIPLHLYSSLQKEACSIQTLLGLNLIDVRKNRLGLKDFSYIENSVFVAKSLLENSYKASKQCHIYLWNKWNWENPICTYVK